jgi:hypothetical protein
VCVCACVLGGTARAASFVQEALEVGVSHWTTPDADQPWHRRVLLDVCAVYSAILLGVGLIARVLLGVFASVWQKVAVHLAPPLGSNPHGGSIPLATATARNSPPWQPPTYSSSGLPPAYDDELGAKAGAKAGLSKAPGNLPTEIAAKAGAGVSEGAGLKEE